MDNPIFVSTRHVDTPWIAADLAVLNEAAVDVSLDIDLHLLAAIRTRDPKLVGHVGRSYCNADRTAMPCTRAGGSNGGMLRVPGFRPGAWLRRRRRTSEGSSLRLRTVPNLLLSLLKVTSADSAV
jgi:hypothetical protein